METYNKYIGKVFGKRYRIEKVLGLGGMAVVFMATDLGYGRTVALKMLREDMAQDPANVKRFENESKAVVLLDHENIVKIYDVNVDGSLKYFVMEYLEGITLKDYINKKGKLDTDEIISCAEQILRALEHAHSKGIIHRDIKPQNVMLLRSGQIKVTDFGIAKLPSAETVTMEDKAIGTVYYISPEQASGKRVDNRTDIYSLGALLYEMATGTLPFDGDNSVSIALMHIKEDPIPPRELDKRIPEGLEAMIVKAMKRPLEDRFQTASEMLAVTLKLKKNPSAIKIKSNKGGHTKTTERGGTAMFPIILGATCAFLIALLIAGYHLINVFIVEPMNRTDEFKVENYDNYVWNEPLKNELEELFSEVIVEYEYSSKYESGQVIRQSVAPNLVRKIKASAITITVSLGHEQMTMPDLRYLSQHEAISKINNYNFDLKIDVEEQYHDQIETGRLITTSPAPSETINKGGKVILYVSLGENVQKVDVPDLVFDTLGRRRNEQTAYKLLEDAGLKLGKVTYEQNVHYEKGTVLRQSISKGTKVSPSITSIDLVISGGLDGEVKGDIMYMIDVSSLTLSVAQNKLNSYGFGFSYKIEYIPSNKYPEGIVVSTDPEPRIQISRNSTITLFVSTGAASVVNVPNVCGMTEAEARAALAAAGLIVGEVQFQYTTEYAPGLVCHQSIEAYRQVPEGTVVNIFISRG